MQNYSYSAKFEHGGAQGEVQAESEMDAKARVKKMYHGQLRDTGVDEDGNQKTEATVVTDVEVTLIEE